MTQTKGESTGEAGARKTPPRSLFFWISLLTTLVFTCLILILLFADGYYLLTHKVGAGEFWRIMRKPEILRSVRMTLVTSLCSLVLVLAFSIPLGYTLSRWRFPGRTLVSVLVDVPIVLPPVVVGVSLLAIFGTEAGMCLKRFLGHFGISLISGFGIVLCQFLVSVSYCIRSAKSAFDDVDPEMENVALVLGCSEWQAFRRVTLPLSRGGLIAGGIMAWARSVGVFGPLMVFVGTSPRVQVMPTSVWLELSIGNIETSLTIALVMVLIAGTALALVHCFSPGRKVL